MTLSTYLAFEGNCREAFEFYRSVFGGEFDTLSTFADAPEDMSVPEDKRDWILHVSLPVGSSVLMGSDMPARHGGALVKGDNFSISIEGKSKAHCDEVLARLSDGGTVRLPLRKTFWGAYFGAWTDRFGINWMINYPLPSS